MTDYRALAEKIAADEQLERQLDWGEPRYGHPEGSIRAHIEEVERNVEALRPKLTPEEYWKLRVLAHVHDAFKGEAREGVSLRDPASHASLARKYLAGLCGDQDLLNMVQFHDEAYSLWRQMHQRGHFDHSRLDALIHLIKDWNIFLAFSIVDGSTEGKNREPLRGLFEQVQGRVESRCTAADIPPAPGPATCLTARGFASAATWWW